MMKKTRETETENFVQTLSWSKVSLSVQQRRGCQNDGSLPVLKSLTGSIRAGEIACVLGHSGAGKTSFFNVLTGHYGGHNLSGNFVLNGKPLVPSTMENRRKFAYAVDGDPLDDMATPREAIYFSAKLRLNAGTSEMDIKNTVGTILQVLNLETVADNLIGGGDRGLSAGERRRVCLGKELVVSPDIIVLDEVTSGKSIRSWISCPCQRKVG